MGSAVSTNTRTHILRFGTRQRFDNPENDTNRKNNAFMPPKRTKNVDSEVSKSQTSNEPKTDEYSLDTLIPVGKTIYGQSGYYAQSLNSAFWQYWSYDSTNGWTLCADQVEPFEEANGKDNTWIRSVDCKTGYPYYYNTKTRETSWECPVTRDSNKTRTPVESDVAVQPHIDDASQIWTVEDPTESMCLEDVSVANWGNWAEEENPEIESNEVEGVKNQADEGLLPQVATEQDKVSERSNVSYETEKEKINLREQLEAKERCMDILRSDFEGMKKYVEKSQKKIKSMKKLLERAKKDAKKDLVQKVKLLQEELKTKDKEIENLKLELTQTQETKAMSPETMELFNLSEDELICSTARIKSKPLNVVSQSRKLPKLKGKDNPIVPLTITEFTNGKLQANNNHETKDDKRLEVQSLCNNFMIM